MDDAMVAQCGHSFGHASLQRVLETVRFGLCLKQVEHWGNAEAPQLGAVVLLALIQTSADVSAEHMHKLRGNCSTRITCSQSWYVCLLMPLGRF